MPDFVKLVSDIGRFIQENFLLSVSVLVFLSVVLFTLAITSAVRYRTSIQRRTAIGTYGRYDEALSDRRSLRHADLAVTQRILRYVTDNFLPSDTDEISKIRRTLILSGFYDRPAVAWYFTIRITLLLGLPVVAFLLTSVLIPDAAFAISIFAAAGAAGVAMLAPSYYLSRRQKRLREQYRIGFPEFMDLLIVCVDAGLGIESAIDRVGREMSYGHPALSQNIYMMSLELRAGKSLGDALHSLSDRLGIEESNSLANLLIQSQELGTSLIGALRVYSEEMRDKRMSRAEEKAASLPVKLVIPLGLFLFPVMLIIIMAPIVVRFQIIGIF